MKYKLTTATHRGECVCLGKNAAMRMLLEANDTPPLTRGEASFLFLRSLVTKFIYGF